MFKKVKGFLIFFIKTTIPTKRNYQNLSRSSLLTSFSYSFFLVLIFSLIIWIFFLGILNPINIKKLIESLGQSLQNTPRDYEFYVSKGRLFTSKSYPLLFWFYYNNQRRLFLVVDETADKEKINSYQTPILISSEDIHLLTDNNRGIIKTYPLASIGDLSFDQNTRAKIISFLENLNKNYLKFILPLILIIFFIFLIINMALIYSAIIFSSVLIFLIYKFFYKKKYHLKKILILSNFSSTIPILLTLISFVVVTLIPLKIDLKVSFFVFLITFYLIFFGFSLSAVYLTHNKNDKIAR